MRVRRVQVAPEDVEARRSWDWLAWMGSEALTLDEMEARVGPGIAAHITSCVIDWLEMGAIEVAEDLFSCLP